MAIKKYESLDCAILIILAILVVGIFCWIWGYNAQGPTETNDSIIYRDSIIIDSIYVEIDSIETVIKYIHDDYEEKTATVINATDSANYVFFTDYISNYSRSITDR